MYKEDLNRNVPESDDSKAKRDKLRHDRLKRDWALHILSRIRYTPDGSVVPEDYKLYQFCKEVLETTELYGKELLK